MLNICIIIYTLIKMKRLVVLMRTVMLLVALNSIIIPSVQTIPYDNYFNLYSEGIPAGQCIWTNDNDKIWAAQVRIVVNHVEFSSVQ
jgi:hypothetical protein